MAKAARWLAALWSAMALGFALSPAVRADKAQVYQSGRDLNGIDLAIAGYDTVAYHTLHKPVLGSPTYRVSWKSAEWRFASATNRDLFAKSPGLYAPQFGGYCAYAVAYGATAPGDPKLFTIVNGKLYLNLNETVQASWLKDKEALIPKAEANWPKVLQ